MKSWAVKLRLILVLLLAGSAVLVRADSDTDATPSAAAIASAHPLATAAGIEILEQGGNAFDAAIAVSAALGVVEPQSSGFGGGAFWLLHRAADGYEIMVDGREAAPAAAHQKMYLDAKGKPDRNASLTGARAAGIPGLIAGLQYLSEHFGRLSLGACLGPAIRLARDGFPVTERFHQILQFSQTRLKNDPGAAQVLFPNGAVPPVGALIRQPALAATLERIAQEGAQTFYRGPLAQALVDGVRAAGGIWTPEDMRAYEIKLRAPLIGYYRDIRIVSAPPPSSGGVVLLEALNLLEQYDLADMDEGARKHLIVEAMRYAYRDRVVYLGDPDFVDIPIERLIGKDYARERVAMIDLEAATRSVQLPIEPGVVQSEGSDTSHFSVLDREGNRVAGTQSINIIFGAGMLEPSTGIVLNDEMDDFALPDLTPNAYGLIGTHANSVQPGKRPLSSMTPTFLETADRVGILGTPGGSRIISMVLLGVLDFEAGHLPESWVAVPRYHHQFLPDVVEYESGALSEAELEALEARGHQLQEARRQYGNMQAILWNKANGRVWAASDPRGEGRAVVH
jgi:gamma-glutamyltranspeptidase/glutathione hydrolase